MIKTGLAAAIAGLPKRTDRATVQRSMKVSMRDGAELVTDLWLPGALHPSTSLTLVRTPYGRAGMDLIARLLAERGHPVVVQSCRGTFGSSGEFEPFLRERTDGEDTLTWIAQQPWGQRPVSLLGASYFGHTAYSTVKAAPNGISSIAVAVTATDMHANAIYPNNALALESAAFWISGLETQELSWRNRRRLTRKLKRRMPLALTAAEGTTDFALLEAPYSPYRQWVEHADPGDSWWSPFKLSSIRANMPPAVFVAGWYDPFVSAQLEDYEATTNERHRSRLVVGPWTHASVAVAAHLVRESLLLQDGRNPSTATVWDAGMKRWVEMPTWPPVTQAETLTLTANDLLASDPSDETHLSWSVDPTDPPPPAGGRGLNPEFAGRRRQTTRERHRGIRILTSNALPDAVTIAGRCTVLMNTEPTDHAQDWFVRLCDVDKHNVSRNIADGFARSAAGVSTVTLRLSPAAFTFGAGHRVRVQIAGTGYPFHSGASLPEARSLVSAPAAWSTIELPVVAGGWLPTATISRRFR